MHRRGSSDDDGEHVDRSLHPSGSKDDNGLPAGPAAPSRPVPAVQQPSTNPSPARPPTPGRGGGPRRFFVLKSTNMENVERSMQTGLWSTQRHNEDKLNKAYRESSEVVLVFSVNGSGHFQGYARMTSGVGRNQADAVAWEGVGRNVGNTFHVEWLRSQPLGFQQVEHLRNPWNEDKPVKICRDGTELPPDLGKQLCELIDSSTEPAVVGAPPGGRGAGMPGSLHSAGMAGPTLSRGLPAGMDMGMGMAQLMGLPMGLGMNPLMMMGGFPGMGGLDLSAAMGMGGLPAMMMRMNGGGGDIRSASAVPPPRPPTSMHPDKAQEGSGRAPAAMHDRRTPPSGRPSGRDFEIRPPSEPWTERDGQGRGRYRSPDRRPSRSRGRERSRSPPPWQGHDDQNRQHGHDRERSRPNFLDMDYPGYTREFSKVRDVRRQRSHREHTERSTAAPPLAMLNPGPGLMNPMMGVPPMLNPMLDPAAALGMLPEEEQVVQFYRNYYKQAGQPFDPQRCRDWYRRFKASMTGR